MNRIGVLFSTAILGFSLVWLCGCSNDDSPVAPPTSGIQAFTFSGSGQLLSVPNSGGAVKAKLTGGTLPYSVASAPDPAIATVSMSNDTITVTPVGAGTTSITINDASVADNLPLSVVIGITVSGGGGSGGGISGSGTFSFTSPAGNLSANGAWGATSGSGVGVLRRTDAGRNYIYLFAYVLHSATSSDVAVLLFNSTSTIGADQYSFSEVPPPATLSFNYNVSPTDTFAVYNGYVTTTGHATISSISATNIQGVFEGGAIQTPPNTGTTSVGSGQFNVNTTQPNSQLAPPWILATVRRMINQM